MSARAATARHRAKWLRTQFERMGRHDLAAMTIPAEKGDRFAYLRPGRSRATVGEWLTLANRVVVEHGKWGGVEPFHAATAAVDAWWPSYAAYGTGAAAERARSSGGARCGR